MKTTLNWLRQYVDFDWAPEELAERLTMLGLEVESLQKTGAHFEGIVVAEVLTRDPHPDADKLSLCRVNDGQGERQIVCGATNFQAGDKVALILPGATLPTQPGQEPFTIKVGKIRGVKSHGMMCSPKELGLAEEADGLLILRPDAQVGQPFAQYLGPTDSDVVYDLEITPNRPDLNSVLGIAREIAAYAGNPLRTPELPETATAPDTPTADQLTAVRLDAPELCPRYTVRLIQGVKIGPSPGWLRDLLEKVGIRSINNIVDVTNYVLMETGQPLHAFDYHRIAKSANGRPTIVVRRAQAGETFTTLDDQTHELTPDALLIADDTQGIALAGVMGGLNTEINEQTVDVLLESAWFLPSNIRRTSKSLGLRTDASYRFERGADIGITDWASLRAATLITELAGGQIAPGVVDAYPQPYQPTQITLRHHKVNELLGLELPPHEMENHLTQLGLKAPRRKPRPVDEPPGQTEPATFVIPTWRPDLKREADLIEEIVRLHGVDRIPSTAPRGALGSNAHDAVHDDLAEARQLLTGLGLHEAQGQTLISEAAAHQVTPDVVHLSNPLSSDMNVLRPSLLPGLLDSLRHNATHQNLDVALFEIGRIFTPSPSKTAESRSLAIALTGRRQPGFWLDADRDATYDIHDLKGILEEFLLHFGLRGTILRRNDPPQELFVESASVTLGGKVPIGQLGQLAPAIARDLDLRHPVFLAELPLDELMRRRITARSFKPLPSFPGIRRDIALLIEDSVSHETVLKAVRRAKPAHLEQVELFDVFRGKNLPPNQKSAAYTFSYRSPDRTLTDAEVNTEHTKVVEHLKQALPATIRE